ncbi:acetylxylan esterase [Ruania alkalisoli]|uniref:Acetylxylan esterase n=1 Tax=Ruania alkalisoli TaxID=2779775 RepID=A0A7M1SV20_9MICO|nr:acetylxylan esterase [Ruania alkalisoli]QOR70592.1 acetylxylan esterase [Ruania alkalisoli]
MSNKPERSLGDYQLPRLWGPVSDRSPEAWRTQRAPQIVEAFAANVYGRTPSGGGVEAIVEKSRVDDALDATAVRRELTITVSGPRGSRDISMLLFHPSNISAPAPVLLGLNFQGNHSTTSDEGVALSRAWVKAPAPRGNQARRWPYDQAIARGYAVATIHHASLEEDRPGAAATGVRGLFHTAAQMERDRQPDHWGAIGAWAWGLARALDAIGSLPELDARRVIVHGHSRLGKTALWAAAQDQRFAAAISNDSGCAGASLFRHQAGENIDMITQNFPHWFCEAFNRFQHAEASLPIDQHQLLAAIAPRPVHIASADLDAHADPRGEFLSTVHASPVVELFGGRGTVATEGAIDVPAAEATAVEMPPIGVRAGHQLSYHIRAGGHDVLAEDWKHFMDFADQNLPDVS